MNAGSFHILLGNILGRGDTFIADVDRGGQVWNQPMVSYRSTINGNTVRSEVEYTTETEQKWEAHAPDTEKKTLIYHLDLTAGNEIVGGQHLSAEKWDFAWKMPPPRFAGYFGPLAALYNAATSQGASVHSWEAGLEDSGVFVPPTDMVDGYWTKVQPMPWVAPANFSNVQTMDAMSGVVSLDALTALTSTQAHTWLIQPNGAQHQQQVQVSIPPPTGLKDRDTLKVYEGRNCDGALVFAQDGRFIDDLAPTELSMQAPFCVVFEATPLDATRSFEFEADQHGGFELSYETATQADLVLGASSPLDMASSLRITAGGL